MREENDPRPPDSIMPPGPHLPRPSEQIIAGNGLVVPPARYPAQSSSEKNKQTSEHKDGFREVAETVVFVVVLVLLLKTFLAEAFVIPTGSMAETLLGYHKEVECPSCKHHFPVNYSSEADPQEGPAVEVTGCTCPNCHLFINLSPRPGRPEQ
jgi:hypothetical protein